MYLSHLHFLIRNGKRWSGNMVYPHKNLYIVVIQQVAQNRVDHFKFKWLAPKGDQPLRGDLHAVLDKIEADMLQTTKKQNQKWIIKYQGTFDTKTVATNASSVLQYEHLQGWLLNFQVNLILNSYQNSKISVSKNQKNYSNMNECVSAQQW